MAKKSFYIKQRHNPQLGVFYVACGQLTVKEAKAKESAIYGSNVMMKYPTEKEYNEARANLKC